MVEEIIINKLSSNKEDLSIFFKNSNQDFGCRFFVVDDLLPLNMAIDISNKFPNYSQMRLLSSLREKKYTSKNFSVFDPLIKKIGLALQNKNVINQIEHITGISNQVGDPTFYAGGVSSMGHGHFLNPHIDNSHNYELTHYRTLNLLYYITPDWKKEYGGNLELWDKSVRSQKVITSKFNRLIVMETNRLSWHSVSEVKIENKFRNCISNYFFSLKSPMNFDYSNVTSFMARPNQKGLRLLCMVDNKIRQTLRIFKKKGFAKVDLNK